MVTFRVLPYFLYLVVLLIIVLTTMMTVKPSETFSVLAVHTKTLKLINFVVRNYFYGAFWLDEGSKIP